VSYEASAADAELARRASAAGACRVSPRQVWRWRRLGLIPAPTRRFLGRAHGSRSEYPEGTIELVAAIAQALREVHRLDDVALALFADGWPIDLRLVRRIVIRRVIGLTQRVTTLGGDSDDWSDRVERAGLAIRRDAGLVTLTSMFRSNLRTRGSRSPEALLSAINDWILIFTHTDAGTIEQPGDSLLKAMGLEGTSIPLPRRQLLGAMTADHVTRIVMDAPDRHLLLARDGARLFLDEFDRLATAIIDSGSVRRMYGLRGEEMMRRDRATFNTASGGIARASLVLAMLLVLDLAGESKFRDTIVSTSLLLHLVRTSQTGGELELQRMVSDFDRLEISLRESVS